MNSSAVTAPPMLFAPTSTPRKRLPTTSTVLPTNLDRIIFVSIRSICPVTASVRRTPPKSGLRHCSSCSSRRFAGPTCPSDPVSQVPQASAHRSRLGRGSAADRAPRESDAPRDDHDALGDRTAPSSSTLLTSKPSANCGNPEPFFSSFKKR
jgi:hypothetical protein